MEAGAQPEPQFLHRQQPFSGVAATSAANAWAVGSDLMVPVRRNKPRSLIEHWNGTAWKQQTSPSPTHRRSQRRGGDLRHQRLGGRWAAQGGGSLIAHWNGTAWKQQYQPQPGSHDDVLTGAAATSATNVWSVGSYSNGGASKTLAVHFC